jgi:hypothetical protein
MSFEKGSKEETRRSLVRGSVAAPLLLTLRPAGAQALTSATACVGRNAANPPTGATTKIANNPDQMFRVQVPVWHVKLKANAGEGDFARINDVYYNRTTYVAFLNVNDPSIAQAQAVSGEFDYALVYVDPVTGQTTGVAPPTTSGNAISTSCWTSLSPRPITPTV